MGRRLLRGSVKLGIIAAVIAGLVIVSKKLMGGLGPEPGSEQAPKAWPSLIPEPQSSSDSSSSDPSSSEPTGSNGNAAAAAAADADVSND